MSSVMPIALTIRDTTKASGFARTRIYELIGSGAIAAVKEGRRTLVLGESLRDYIAKLPPANIRKAA